MAYTVGSIFPFHWKSHATPVMAGIQQIPCLSRDLLIAVENVGRRDDGFDCFCAANHRSSWRRRGAEGASSTTLHSTTSERRNHGRTRVRPAGFYRALLARCMLWTCVCLSVCHKPVLSQNGETLDCANSGFQFSGAKDLGEIRLGSPLPPLSRQ